MKKSLLIISAVVFAAGTMFSQALNGGFETWGSQAGEPTQPTGWVTANVFASPLVSSSNPTSAFQAGTPNNYMGTYSLRLVSVKLVSNPDPQNIPDTLGVAVTGTVTFFPQMTLRDRIPFTARPATMNFGAKYTPMGVDTAFIYMELSKWNTSTGQRDIIFQGGLEVSASANYQNFSIPLSTGYLMPDQPDSLSIGISCTSYNTPRVGSQLWIDNVSFSGWVGQEEYVNDVVVKTFPNPATETITIDATGLTAELGGLEIFDMSGKKVFSTSMRNAMNVSVNVSEFAPGNYTYSLIGIQGIRLHEGKFTVTR
jgi:hypothetical protein